MPTTVMEVERGINNIKLDEGNTKPNGDQPARVSWLEDTAKVQEVGRLRDMALQSCRVVYGSERFRFYDLVVGSHDDGTRFTAALICNLNTQTKILRKEQSNDPLLAVRTLADRLQKDAGLVLNKFTTGAVVDGQQGWCDSVTGEWVLDDSKEEWVDVGPADLIHFPQRKSLGKRGGGGDYYVPHGPRRECKRPRKSDSPRPEEEPNLNELY